MLLPLVTSSFTVPKHLFWPALLVYHARPHIVNKRIIGVSQAYFYKAEFTKEAVEQNLFTFASVIYEVRKLTNLNRDSLKDLVTNILQPHDKCLHLEETSVESFSESDDNIYISVRVLLPKHVGGRKRVEIVVLDKKRTIATFYAVGEKNEPILAPPFPYMIEVTSTGNLRILVANFEDADTSCSDWLVGKLFPKLIKWCTDGPATGNPSLTLVDINRYADIYHNLKIKYGKRLVNSWTEVTDPKKFVYEDIAIAAYLICVWEQSCEEKPSFVDLGCGNGLLVHILSEEGYPGYGVDVKRRKIWDTYPKTTKLQVAAITPSDNSLYPDVNWIIGNHSDELTPWIPVLAFRSAPTVNFFLLPCCSYDFNGKKYSRLNTSTSQYSNYLNYIKTISSKCGFVVKTDKLRIPSTKKTCFIGYSQEHREEERARLDEQLSKLITQKSYVTTKWVDNFKPRCDVEKVRNCTQLDKCLIDRIVHMVAKNLLTTPNMLKKCDGGLWNAGGKLSIAELVTSIPREDLKALKSECGGLQTLLRNHRYIFQLENGSVSIRVPATVTTTDKYKDKRCWFMKNHPDGCIHDVSACAYKHVE